MPDTTPPIAKVEPSSKGKTPPVRSLIEDQIIRASYDDKVKHLLDKIERLKKLPREQGGEALRRAEMNLANVKESISKL